MNITKARQDDFIKMMTKIAGKHNCIINFEVKSTDVNYMKVDIEYAAILRRWYEIDWKEEPSLTDAAVSIWADFFGALAQDPIVQYNRMDVALTAELANKLKSTYITELEIKNVIFNDPATIVFWNDGTKTVVKCQDGDEFDPEKGLAMAISKKTLGNKGNYCEVFKKWCEPYNAEPIYPKVPTINFPVANELKKVFEDIVDRRIARMKEGMSHE